MRNDKFLPESPLPGSHDKAAISTLRLLDFDDLFLLKHLLEGATIAATARQLGLTQPAITQRVRKIERVFGEPILQKVGRHVKLTKDGHAICARAADALALMHEVASEPATRALCIGVGPTQAKSLAWPALLQLREQMPDVLCHLSIGSQDDLMTQLEAGRVQALLSTHTQMPSASGGGSYGRLDIAEYDYVFVAANELAERIKHPQDLAAELLLELDRSLSLLQRLEMAARAQLRFRDVWFLGSEQLIIQAALQGFGVAIVPASLAEPLIAAQKLKSVLPELDVRSDMISLLYRKDRSSDVLIEHLVKLLRTQP